MWKSTAIVWIIMIDLSCEALSHRNCFMTMNLRLWYHRRSGSPKERRGKAHRLLHTLLPSPSPSLSTYGYLLPAFPFLFVVTRAVCVGGCWHIESKLLRLVAADKWLLFEWQKTIESLVYYCHQISYHSTDRNYHRILSLLSHTCVCNVCDVPVLYCTVSMIYG